MGNPEFFISCCHHRWGPRASPSGSQPFHPARATSAALDVVSAPHSGGPGPPSQGAFPERRPSFSGTGVGGGSGTARPAWAWRGLQAPLTAHISRQCFSHPVSQAFGTLHPHVPTPGPRAPRPQAYERRGSSSSGLPTSPPPSGLSVTSPDGPALDSRADSGCAGPGAPLTGELVCSPPAHPVQCPRPYSCRGEHLGEDACACPPARLSPSRGRLCQKPWFPAGPWACSHGQGRASKLKCRLPS